MLALIEAPVQYVRPRPRQYSADLRVVRTIVRCCGPQGLFCYETIGGRLVVSELVTVRPPSRNLHRRPSHPTTAFVMLAQAVPAAERSATGCRWRHGRVAEGNFTPPPSRNRT
jgi:hypothetical protein